MLIAAPWCYMWGRSPIGSNGTCSTLYPFSVTPSAVHIQIGPFWCCFLSGWACARSRPLWANELSCEAGSFSHCHLNPHRCFQSVVWGFISPCWSPGLCGLSHHQLFLPVYPHTNVGLSTLPAVMAKIFKWRLGSLCLHLSVCSCALYGIFHLQMILLICKISI